jgi:hypothetical protein
LKLKYLYFLVFLNYLAHLQGLVSHSQPRAKKYLRQKNYKNMHTCDYQALTLPFYTTLHTSIAKYGTNIQTPSLFGRAGRL